MTAAQTRMDNYVVASVGGQGGLLATGVIADALRHDGPEVKTSEVHGMAQRGGSVLSFVRRSDGRPFGPVVGSGSADVVLGLEMLEAVRALPYIRACGLVVASTQRVMPVPVTTGQAKYPDDLEDRLRTAAGQVVLVPAGEIAQELGNSRVANVVCLGALAGHTDGPLDVWREVISKLVPPRTVDINLQAFARGVELAGVG